jgi:hypothetical protein
LKLMHLAADLGDEDAGQRLENKLAMLRERAASGSAAAQGELAEWKRSS